MRGEVANSVPAIPMGQFIASSWKSYQLVSTLFSLSFNRPRALSKTVFKMFKRILYPFPLAD